MDKKKLHSQKKVTIVKKAEEEVEVVEIQGAFICHVFRI